MLYIFNRSGFDPVYLPTASLEFMILEKYGIEPRMTF
jgi:hypothetical protein